VLEGTTFNPTSAGTDRRRDLVVVIAALLFAAVFAARTLVEDPAIPVGFFYGVPVTFVALYLGPRAAVIATAAAVALIAVAVAQDRSDPVGVAVAIAFSPFAWWIAKVAEAMRETAVSSRDAEERLATVVETVLEGYIEMDDEGRITEMNAEAQELFGWPREDALGRDLALTLLPQERRAEFRESLTATLEGREASLFGRWHDEWTALRRDGKTVTVEWMVAPVRQAGKWQFFIWVFDVTHRVRADEARKRLASIVEDAPVALVTTDTEGVIKAWNPKAAETFGWSAQEIVGRTVDETIVPAPFRQAFVEGRKVFRETGNAPGLGERIEMRALHRDGHEFPIEMTMSAVETEDGWTFTAFMHDISARRREEGERLRMAAIVEASADGIYSYSLDGIVTSWNPGAERLYGYSAKEMVGSSIGRIAPPDRPDDFSMVLDRVRDGERLESYEATRVAKGGRAVEVALTVSPVRDETGEIVEAAVTARDISEKKRIETYRQNQYEATRLLAEAEEPAAEIPRLLGILGEGSGWPCGALWYRDGSDRRFRCAAVWENPAAPGSICPFEEGQPFELPQAAPSSVAWVRFDQPDSDEALPGRDDASEAGVRTALWVPVTIDGTVLGAVELMTRRSLEREEELIATTSAVSSLLTELMKRRHAESEAERLKDEFFGMVSHEMRTPLTSIIGYTELLGEFEAERLSDQGKGFLEVIERNARREMRLVGDLLALVRIEGGSFSIEPEPTDFAQVARQAADAAAPRAEQGRVKLTATVEPMPMSLADPHRLGQVVDNLLSNAIKFSPEEGTVDLRLTREGDTAILEVEDTGIGIPEDEQEKLFDRLYRASSATERHIQGLGLGLTITKAIVEAHDGKISVTSQEGVGTTFRVELPLKVPEDDPSDQGAQGRDTVAAR
jgi:PAS domain S-box-containing protein